MDKNDIKRVKQWLYSIPKTELAIYNLEQAIEDLRERIEHPPSYIMSGISNYYGVMITGGEDKLTKQQNYVEWMETQQDRLSFLEECLDRHNRKVMQYRETLEKLKLEPKWGYLAGEIIQKKYHCKIRPDKAIYTMFLFCSRESFYREHRRGLQYFFDVLPNVFLRNKKMTLS